MNLYKDSLDKLVSDKLSLLLEREKFSDETKLAETLKV